MPTSNGHEKNAWGLRSTAWMQHFMTYLGLKPHNSCPPWTVASIFKTGYTLRWSNALAFDGTLLFHV